MSNLIRLNMNYIHSNSYIRTFNGLATMVEQFTDFMVEQFTDFLSEELLEFCSYGTQEDNYIEASANCDDLDALTNLSSKKIDEYFHNIASKDYSANNLTNTESMRKKTDVLAQTPRKSIRNFATPKTDNKVTEARKTGVRI